MPDLTRLIETWGYVGVAVVVVLGNLGVPVPEETVLAMGGYLVRVGRLRWLPLLAVGFVSAVVDDNIGSDRGRPRTGAPDISTFTEYAFRSSG